MVKIIIDANPYEIDEATKNIMEYIAEVQTVEGSAKEEVLFYFIQHDIPNIHKEAFEQLLEACKICGNNFPEITKIKGGDAKEYIGNDLNGFLSKLNNTELNDLFKAAHFLKIKGLEMCIAAFLACRVYIPLSLEAYEAKKK